MPLELACPFPGGSTVSNHCHDDLAFGPAGFQIGYRLLGLGEGEDAVDDDFKLLGIDERGYCSRRCSDSVR
jgi:hypothetical protein